MEPLADDFWRIAHDDANGRRRVDHATTSLGLAAALLGELWLSRHIHIDQGHLQVVGDWPEPHDPLPRSILQLLAAETTDTSIPSWLAFLRTEAYSDVGRRMASAGHLRSERRLGRTVWMPADMLRAAKPSVYLRGALVEDWQLGEQELCLAALMFACGLNDPVLSAIWNPAKAQRRLHWWLSHPSLNPSIAELARYTRGVASRTAMTARV